MRDIELLQKEVNEAVGMRARLGSPTEPIGEAIYWPPPPKCPDHPEVEMELISETQTGLYTWERVYRCPVCGKGITAVKSVTPVAEEDSRLRDLLDKIAERERILQALREEIARLEAKVSWTAEEEAERARLQSLIDEEEAKIREIEAQIPPITAKIEEEKAAIDTLRGYIATWNTRIEVARKLGYKMEEQTREKGLYTNWHLIKPEYEACEGWWDAVTDRFIRQSTCYNAMWALAVMLEGKWYVGYYCRPTDTEIPNAQVIDTLVHYAQGKIAELESQLRDHTRTLENLEAQLRDLQDDLERAKRRLGDAIAALERYILAITRAVALRQAEVDAAKARYELELRTLENLKAAYDVLLKEIELAKLEAIAEAARQREAVVKAEEKERAGIAEQQTALAESLEALAREAVGLEREEFLEKMRRAAQIAKEAQEAAIAAAKEREDIAKAIAAKKAELARLELELEESRKTLGITAEEKEEAEKKVAGIPVMPWWGWVALGVGGLASAGGIAYVAKKKKKKVK